MKNMLFILLSALLLTSSTSAATVDQLRAGAIARQYFNSQTTAARGNALQLRCRDEVFNSYYIFTPADQKGFVVVAGDDLLPPVLGFSAEGSFSGSDMNPEFRFWLQHYANALEFAHANGLQQSEAVARLWDQQERGETTPDNIVVLAGPLLRTTWSQAGGTYNAKCPIKDGARAVTGCVATAMGQIMKYWNWPIAGQGDYCYEHDDYGVLCAHYGDAYDWDHMPDALTDGTTASNQIKIDAVSTLLSECGISVEMNYGPDGSGANNTPLDIDFFGWGRNAQVAYAEQFRYNEDALDDYDHDNIGASTSDMLDVIRNELMAGRPVQFEGNDESNGKAHSWVCDGIRSDNWVHMNWGWGGLHDGWFLVDNLVPGRNFTNDQIVLFGITPQSACRNAVSPTGVWPLPVTEANRWIRANCAFQPGETRIFNAGTFITLDTGFVAPAGADFSAFIGGGCVINAVAERQSEEPPPLKQPVQRREMLQLAPNPFSGSTTITYVVPKDAPVDMRVFNSMGTELAQPLPAQWMPAGEYTLRIDGQAWPPGVYTLVWQCGTERTVKRLVLSR